MITSNDGNVLREQLETLRNQREVAVLRQQIEQIENARRLEQFLLTEAAYGFSRSDPIAGSSDSPGFPGGPEGEGYVMPLVQRSDRRNGNEAPWFETEDQLSMSRGAGRYLCKTSEIAIGVMALLLNYTIGNGCVYDVTPNDAYRHTTSGRRVRRNRQPSALEMAVSDDLDKWHDKVNWPDLEAELFIRGHRDGEVFSGIEEIADSQWLVIEEPEWVAKPDPEDEATRALGLNEDSVDWTWGIATAPWREWRPLGYFVFRDEASYRLYRPSELVHLKLNVDRNVKRGVSDFWSVWSEFRRADKIMRNTGEGAALQAAICWIREHAPGVDLQRVSNMISGGLEARLERTSGMGSVSYEQFSRYAPGTVLDVPNGQQYKEGPLANRNERFVETAQALHRHIAARWNIPEYMISADASNANYSSTLVAESPFVKSTQRRQYMWCRYFESLHWMLLSAWCKQGRYRRYGIEAIGDLRQAVSLQVSAPDPFVRDRQAETMRLSQLTQAGIIAPATWATAEGFDLDEEREAGAKAMDAGHPKAQQPDAAGLAAVQGALESVQTTAEARAVLRQIMRTREAFDPNQPRGDDGKWIDDDDIAVAAGNKAEAKKLRARVTDPDERKKLDKKLASKTDSEIEFAKDGAKDRKAGVAAWEPERKEKASDRDLPRPDIKPSKARTKRTIDQGASELAKRGYTMVTGVQATAAEKWETSYVVRDPDGKEWRMTSGQISTILKTPSEGTGGTKPARAPRPSGGGSPAAQHKTHVSRSKEATANIKDGAAIVDYYSNTGFVDMNGVARGKTVVPLSAKEKAVVKTRIATLDKVMAAAPPLEDDATVYRGMRIGMKLKQGQTFSDKGFVSTSLDPKVAGRFIGDDQADHTVLEIKIPKGSRVLAPEKKGEMEMVLPRKRKFRVIGTRPGTKKEGLQGRTVTQVEMIS